MFSHQDSRRKNLYDMLGEQVVQSARSAWRLGKPWSDEQRKLAHQYINELTRGEGHLPPGLRRDITEEIRWQFVRLCQAKLPHGSLPAHNHAWYLELRAQALSGRPTKSSFARVRVQPV